MDIELCTFVFVEKKLHSNMIEHMSVERKTEGEKPVIPA
jgi:hypothetical protein